MQLVSLEGLSARIGGELHVGVAGDSGREWVSGGGTPIVGLTPWAEAEARLTSRVG